MTTGEKPGDAPEKGQQTPQPLTAEAISKIVDEALTKRIPGLMSANQKQLNEVRDEVRGIKDEGSSEYDADKPRPSLTSKERELRQREDALEIREMETSRAEIARTLGVPPEEIKGKSLPELHTSALMWLQLNPKKTETPIVEAEGEKGEKPAPDKTVMETGNPLANTSGWSLEGSVADDVGKFLKGK